MWAILISNADHLAGNTSRGSQAAHGAGLENQLCYAQQEFKSPPRRSVSSLAQGGAIKEKYHSNNCHKDLGGGWYSDGIAENIGEMPAGYVQGHGYISSSEDVAEAMMEGWMNSPGHKANILNTKYDTIGIGVAYDGYGKYLLTQDFW